jgi:hypothetical protein
MSIKFKNAEFEIPVENPFTNDKLNRKECADALTMFVQNTPGPLVISINGGWGTGKTAFLKMWNQDLKNKKFDTIYFNAWQDDYCREPLIALIGQIWKDLKETDLEEIANSIKECAGPVFKASIFNAVSTCTGGIVTLDENQLKSVSGKIVDDYIEAGEKLNDLKKRLTKLGQKALEEEKPLIIIIDELDRCRPTFAIELLEKVKHLFDTPGVLFVLGIDREQLGHSIKCVYGNGMEVDGYLRRFLDIEFILPGIKPEVYISHLFGELGLCEYLDSRTNMSNIDEMRIFKNIFSELCYFFNLSLRDEEYCCRTFAIACMNIKEGSPIYPLLLSLLVLLKLSNSKLYYNYVSGNSNGSEVIEFILEQPKCQDFIKSRNASTVIAYLFAASSESWANLCYSQIALLYKKQKLTQPEYMPNVFKTMHSDDLAKILDIWGQLRNRGYSVISDYTLGYLSKRIELASLLLGYRE